MTEHFGFFDAIQDSNGHYDREYNAQQWNEPFRALVTTGVMKGAYNQLEVTVNGANMVSTVKSGIAFIEGRFYFNDALVDLTHDTEVMGLSRIDRIVVRMDSRTEARHVKTFIKKGVPAASPVPPVLTQTQQLYEISLAQVRVVGGQTYIAANGVTDERGKDVICPWAGSNILPNFNDEALEQLVNDVNTKLVDATTTRKGIVQLISSVSSTSTTLAPTAAALKSAYDLTLTKANKSQENYLNLTLLNNWKVGYYARFYKDEFGVVHIRAIVNGGTVSVGTTIATLPVGYRPLDPINQFIAFGSTDDNTYTPVVLNVTSGGGITFYSTGKTWMVIDISFRV